MKNSTFNSDYIKTLKPCKNGLDNFILNYPNFNGKLSELLQLNNISYDHKIWLVKKTVNLKILQQWALECSYLVLNNYEKLYPNDDRVRKCLDITKNFLLGNATIEELNSASSAADSAADSAASSAAYSAASSAAYSASSAAYSASSAARSAAYSVYLAARSASSAAYLEQQDINLSILIALLDNVGE